MAFTDPVWTIPTVLAWIATRDRSEVDRLDYEATRSLIVTTTLVPGAQSARSEFIVKATEGTIAVREATSDGRFEQIEKLVFARAELQEDERGLVVASRNGEATTS